MGDYRANIHKKNPNGGQNLSSSCLKCLAAVYFTLYFQTFWKNMGFLKIVGTNMRPNAKKLTKKNYI